MHCSIVGYDSRHSDQTGIYSTNKQVHLSILQRLQSNLQLLRLSHQILNLEPLDITAGKHAKQLALAATRLPPKVIKPLHTAHQPRRLRRRHPGVRHDLAMHEDEALLIGEVEVVRDDGVRLRKRAVQLVSGQVREDDRGRVRRRQRAARHRRRGRVERPLQEVDVSACAGVCVGGGRGGAVTLGRLLLLLARQRQDELRVLAGGVGDALVGVDGDGGTDGGGAVCVAEAPEGLDFLGREGEDLLDVEVGAQRLDAGGGGLGDGGGGAGLRGEGVGLWFRGRRRRGALRL